MKLINLTGNTLNIYLDDGELIVIEPVKGQTARVKQAKLGRDREGKGTAGGGGRITVRHLRDKDTQNIPAPKQGVQYIVPLAVLRSMSSGRTDVFAPGMLVRPPGKGKPWGYDGLVVND